MSRAEKPMKLEGPATPQLYKAFWDASRQSRALFGLSLESASDARIVENKLDLNLLMDGNFIEGFSQRELVRLVLFDLFDKAHQVMLREPDPRKPEVQACFRELAFWNTVRMLVDYSIDDLAASPENARRAKHGMAVWPQGMSVKPRGGDEFIPAMQLLPGYTQ